MAADIERIVELKNGRVRLYRSEEQRRRIVEETLKPGVSVAEVARAHGVNTNQVFKWRREYLKDRPELIASTTLLPVNVCDVAPEIRQPELRSRRLTARKSGVIDIDLGHVQVRIEGAADPDCVRAALEGLVR